MKTKAEQSRSGRWREHLEFREGKNCERWERWREKARDRKVEKRMRRRWTECDQVHNVAALGVDVTGSDYTMEVLLYTRRYCSQRKHNKHRYSSFLPHISSFCGWRWPWGLTKDPQRRHSKGHVRRRMTGEWLFKRKKETRNAIQMRPYRPEGSVSSQRRWLICSHTYRNGSKWSQMLSDARWRSSEEDFGCTTAD